MPLKPGERIPLHDHGDGNSGGRIAPSTRGSGDVGTPVTSHSQLPGVSADQHHAQSHNHSASGDGTSLSPATLILPAATSPAQTAEGSAVWDSDDDVLTVGDGASRRTFGYIGSTAPSITYGTAAAGSSKEVLRKDAVIAKPSVTADLQGFPGGTSTFLRADGTFTVPPGVGGSDSFWDAILTKAGNDTVTNSATYVSDSELTFSIPSSGAYIAQALLLYTTDATGDIKYRFLTSASTFSSALRVLGTDSTSNAVVNSAQRDSATTTATVALGGGSLSIVRLALIDFLFYVGAAATISLQMAQNTQTSGQTATTLAGSRLAYRRLA